MRPARLRLPAALVLAAGLAAVPARSQPKSDEADSVVPVAAAAERLTNVEVTANGAKLRVTIEYARQGAAVYLFPVWAVAEVERQVGGRWERVQPHQPLAVTGGSARRLRVQVVNLLAQEDSRAAVEKRVRERVAEVRGGIKPEAVQLNPPQFKADGYKVVLAAPGAGDAAEVPLSRPAVLPRAVAEDQGLVYLDLATDTLAALAAARSEPVVLRDTYLQFAGQLKARFERDDYLVNVDAVSAAVAALRTELKSSQPAGSAAPDVFVPLAAGGAVDGTTTARSAFAQFIVTTVSVREGSKVDRGLLTEVADRMTQRALGSLDLGRVDDNKRVAVLLGNMTTISGTVGEVKSLSKKSKQDREAVLKKLVDAAEARASGTKVDVGVDVGLTIPSVPLKLGAGVKVGVDAREQEESRRKEQTEAVNRGLDELANHFEGRVPAVSGIEFDQKGLDESVRAVQAELRARTFTVGWSEHRWPGVRLTAAPGLAVAPELLLRQNEALQARYAEVERLLGGPAKLAELADAVKQAKEASAAATAAARRATATAEAAAKTANEGSADAARKAVAAAEAAARRVTEAAEATTRKAADAAARAAKLPDAVDELKEKYADLAAGINAAKLAARAVTWREYKGHTADVNCVAFSPDGKLVATGSDDKTVQLWHPDTGATVRTVGGLTGGVYALAFSPDGSRLASGSNDNSAHLWGTESGLLIRSLTGHAGTVTQVAFSPDGDRLATSCGDKYVRLWDPSDGRQLWAHSHHTGAVFTVAFRPDGREVLSAAADGRAVVATAADGTLARAVGGHQKEVKAAYRPDGKRIVTADSEKKVIVSSHQSGGAYLGEARDELVTFFGDTQSVASVAYSPDGKWLATGGGDGVVRVWDADTGKELKSLHGHTGYVRVVAFSPDGKRLASASYDDTARVWDLIP